MRWHNKTTAMTNLYWSNFEWGTKMKCQRNVNKEKIIKIDDDGSDNWWWWQWQCKWLSTSYRKGNERLWRDIEYVAMSATNVHQVMTKADFRNLYISNLCFCCDRKQLKRVFVCASTWSTTHELDKGRHFTRDCCPRAWRCTHCDKWTNNTEWREHNMEFKTEQLEQPIGLLNVGPYL